MYALYWSRQGGGVREDGFNGIMLMKSLQLESHLAIE
jgi:hypothetical protein